MSWPTRQYKYVIKNITSELQSLLLCNFLIGTGFLSYFKDKVMHSWESHPIARIKKITESPLLPHLDHPFLILAWHILVGYLLTVSCDWNWIPLTKEEKKRGPSIDQIRGKIFS